MAIQPAEKRGLTDVKFKPRIQEYDESIHHRLVLWKDQSGRSVNRIAAMLGRSAALVSQYINKKYTGDIPAIEKDIVNFLRREEDLEFVTVPRIFCATKPSILIWEVLQYCDQKCNMGVALAPSGTGKSETCKEYKRQNRSTIFVTADITTCRQGPVIRLIADKTGGRPRSRSISDLLHAVIDRLKGSRRLIIIDDAHFLNWEAFELVRKIHDCAGVGIVYIGQERLYEQMKGKTQTAYLFDQIYGRITMKRDEFKIEKKDVQMIAETIKQGLDKNCIDYLFHKARGKGRLRVMANLLEMALEIGKNSGRPVDIELFREADRFLMI